MVKVKKYSRKKKKEDLANYRAEIKTQKYGIVPNLIFAMREIWRADKLLVISCFGFAAAMFATRLADTYFQKYVVELAVTGFERRLILMCVGLFLLMTLSNFIVTVTERYRGFVGSSKAIQHFNLLLLKKCVTTDYENKERCENNNSLNKAMDGISLAEECVRRAGFSERLDDCPDGLDTCLYKDFDEKGVEISGGEAQKLCLARAVYKGAPFIVLDEPTAALDPVSEYDIYTKFNSIVGTRTAVYISHRLSSCRFCDDITVLDKGEIAERGNHDSLVAGGGVYAEMWSAQAEYYKDTAGELFL